MRTLFATLLCLSVFSCPTIAQLDKLFTPCSDYSPAEPSNKPAVPTLSTSYQTDMEITVIDNENSSNTHTEWSKDYVDADLRMAKIHRKFQNAMGLSAEEIKIFSLPTSEIFVVEYDEALYNGWPQCDVLDITANVELIVPAYPDANGTLQTSVEGILHFGGSYFKEYFQGFEVVRNIRTSHWKACMNVKPLNDKLWIDYWFSVPEWKSTIRDSPEYPVKAVWKLDSRDITYTGNFFNYLPFVKNPQKFQTDSGVVCPGRKQLKKLPKIGKQIEYRVEQVDPELKVSSWTGIKYDGVNKLSEFKYSSSDGPAHEVHDFNTGILYEKLASGSCDEDPRQAFLLRRLVQLRRNARRSRHHVRHFHIGAERL